MLGILTAVLTLATAYFGWQTTQLTQERNAATTTAESKDSDLTALSTRLDALEATNRDLETKNDEVASENNDLREQLGLPVPDADTSPAGTAQVRRSGTATVAIAGDGLNLDAPKTDPQWSGSGADLDYDGSVFSFAYYGKVRAMRTTQATFDTCRDATGYSNGYSGDLEVGTVNPGDFVCVVTDDDRIAAIKILSFDDSSAEFDIVVYDPPQQQ